MGHFRLFTAVELPEPIAQGLGRACTMKIDGLRWVDQRLLHITLKFIGDFSEERVDELARELEEAHRPGGKIILRDWVCFPEHGRVRIVGVGVIDEGDELAKSYDSIEKIAAGMGVAPEGRKYHPHVTMGRAKIPLGGAIRERLKQHEMSEMEFEAGGFVLYSSELTRTGPIYRVISRYII